MKYYHVDVFSHKQLAGNGLTVVFPDVELSSEKMLKISQEFNQFETIFIFPENNGSIPVRIFTVEEELDFAGHPILGASAVIHRLRRGGRKQLIRLMAGNRVLSVVSEDMNGFYRVTMNQGKASFLGTLDNNDCKEILTALNISADDLYPQYPIEVVSTGLPYLLIPLMNAINRVKIIKTGFEELLLDVGAKFAYFFDPEILECRTWNNSGLVEDVATGSAAGPLCAYLVKNGMKSVNEKIYLKQGSFINRPSIITGWIEDNSDVYIEGDVAFFSQGEIFYVD